MEMASHVEARTALGGGGLPFKSLGGYTTPRSPIDECPGVDPSHDWVYSSEGASVEDHARGVADGARMGCPPR